MRLKMIRIEFDTFKLLSSFYCLLTVGAVQCVNTDAVGCESAKSKYSAASIPYFLSMIHAYVGKCDVFPALFFLDTSALTSQKT